MTRLIELRKVAANYLTRPVVKFLARTAVTPDFLTILSSLLAVGAAVLIITNHLVAAGLVVLAAGFLDMLDGALARHNNQSSRFGAVLDSTIDRISEAVLLFGILVFYTIHQAVLPAILVYVALIGSVLVSYIRARAEVVGIDCRVGLFTRAERVFVLVMGLLFSWLDNALVIALAVIAVFSFFTVWQRLFYVWRQTRSDFEKKERGE